MWTMKEAEAFWKSIVQERNEPIANLTEEINQLKEQSR